MPVSRPLPPARRAALIRLTRIAEALRDAELARLSGVAQTRDRLLASLAALSGDEGGGLAAPLPEPPDPGPGSAADAAPSPDPSPAPPPLAVRLAHLRWIEGQRRQLNQKLARVQADYLRQHPAAARAFGRAQVLDRMARTAAPPRGTDTPS